MAKTIDHERLGLKDVASVLSEGEEKHLLTGSQYKKSLRDGRRVIDCEGREVEDAADHPHLRVVDVVARLMDLQFEPETRDVLTYVDSDSGSRRAVGWQIPVKQDHLWAKYRAARTITRETLGMLGRPPDYGPMMALGFLATIDRVERSNPEFAENMRRFVEISSEHNLLSTDLIVDPQSDKRIPRGEKPGQLRIVEEREDGIVLRGAKVAGSLGAVTHLFTLSTVLGPGLPADASLWCGVPVNSDGLTLLLREPTVQPDQTSRLDHPIDARGEEMDQFIVFDDVFIPREYVFSMRDPELLDFYYESTSHCLWSIMVRLGFRAEILVGTAQAITDILGTNGIPGVQNAISEIGMYAQALRSFSIASIVEAVEWNGVQVPNPDLVTAGRLYSITQYPRVMYLLQDLCGQALISRWPEKVWDHPEFGPLLEQYLPGTGVTAREKNRFFNFVWDLTTGGQAGRVGLFENVNATPPAYIAHLLYEKWDRSDLTRFVREYAGIPAEDHT